MTQIAILGTGLIGASIGLALKANQHVVDLEIVGYDRENQNLKRARKMDAVDRTEGDIAKAVRDANLIILAAPVLANHRLLEEIAPFVQQAAVVTDTGSTKAATAKVAREHLPEGVSYVGGHPMAGKTEVGPDHAEADLFRGGRWVVAAPSWASQSAVQTVLSLAEAVGATPMLMDAEEHDAYVAAISHLPMVAAQVLFGMARRSEAWPELGLLAAGGFKSATRLAGTDPSMAFDILTTNTEQTIHWLDRFIEELQGMRVRLKEADQEALYTEIAQGELDYSAFLIGAFGRQEEDATMDGEQFDFSSMLIGQMAKEKMTEISNKSDERLREIERKRRMKRDI